MCGFILYRVNTIGCSDSEGSFYSFFIPGTDLYWRITTVELRCTHLAVDGRPRESVTNNMYQPGGAIFWAEGMVIIPPSAVSAKPRRTAR